MSLAESEPQGLIGANLEGMDPKRRRLPLPPDDDTRQIFKDTRPRRRARYGDRHEEWVLRMGDVRRVVAWYYPAKRMLTRHIHSSHTYGNKPGIAWNLELLCRADHWNRRPLRLVVVNEAPLAHDELEKRKPYRLEWEIVRAFAHAALEGDDRWLVEDYGDRQLLLPWPAWAGTWTDVPPHRDPELEPEVEHVPLFEMPPDPSARKQPRHFV